MAIAGMSFLLYNNIRYEVYGREGVFLWHLGMILHIVQ